MILVPKKSMTEEQKLFYCSCIKRNKYRYNYGRQANKTLKNLEVPATTPKWVKKVSAKSIAGISKPAINNCSISIIIPLICMCYHVLNMYNYDTDSF